MIMCWRMLPLHKEAKPLVWGAVAGAAFLAIGLFAEYAGVHRPDNPMVATPAAAAGTAFGLAWLMANLRNWYGKRLLGKITVGYRNVDRLALVPTGNRLLNFGVGRSAGDHGSARADSPRLIGPPKKLVGEILPPDRR